jgi:hypothetical protein
MTIWRIENPDICYMKTDAVTLWCHGIVEWRIDTRNRKFIMTPIMRDKSEGPVIDATDAHERSLREQEHGRQDRHG